MGQPQLQIPQGTNPRVPKLAVCAPRAGSASACSPDSEPPIPSGIPTVLVLMSEGHTGCQLGWKALRLSHWPSADAPVPLDTAWHRPPMAPGTV